VHHRCPSLAASTTAVPLPGCHINGGNIIQAGATLFQADLVKNNAADADSLYRLIYAGKGRMPGFGQECTPKVQWWWWWWWPGSGCGTAASRAACQPTHIPCCCCLFLPLQLQCTFGPRLSDEEVQQLVSYVQEQAAADWKQ
jgi:cytochrome c6